MGARARIMVTAISGTKAVWVKPMIIWKRTLMPVPKKRSPARVGIQSRSAGAAALFLCHQIISPKPTTTVTARGAKMTIRL